MTSASDVIDYRTYYNGYVMGMARACQEAGDAWNAAATGGETQPGAPDETIFAAPPDSTTLGLYAQAQYNNSDAIVAAWNAHAGQGTVALDSIADLALADFQKVVSDCQNKYGPQVAHECPAITLPTLPPPPPAPPASWQTYAKVGLGIAGLGVVTILVSKIKDIFT